MALAGNTKRMKMRSGANGRSIFSYLHMSSHGPDGPHGTDENEVAGERTFEFSAIFVSELEAIFRAASSAGRQLKTQPLDTARFVG